LPRLYAAEPAAAAAVAVAAAILQQRRATQKCKCQNWLELRVSGSDSYALVFLFISLNIVVHIHQIQKLSGNDFCVVCLQREVKWPPGMSRVLERTAINLQGLEKHMWLLIADAFSKWVEVEPSDKVINRLYWKLEHQRRLSPPAHPYIAIFELDRPFDHRLLG